MSHIPVPAVPRPGIPKDPLYQPPAIAWPTVALFAAASLLWLGAFYGGLQGWLPLALTIPLQTIAAFMHFTVLHDGVHRSLARGYPRLNGLLSAISGSALGLVGAAAAFRYAHFKHHRTTNEAGVDPDLWSGHGNALTLPLKWATADLYYACVILRDWKQVPVKDRREILLNLAVLGTAAVLLVGAGYGYELLVFWLIPARLAIVWLAAAFNYLPHHPHDVEQRHNPYAATCVREGADAVMKWLFLYQNYHLVHHLYPSVPFYRYLRIWKRGRAEAIRNGAPVVPWYGLVPAGRTVESRRSH